MTKERRVRAARRRRRRWRRGEQRRPRQSTATTQPLALIFPAFVFSHAPSPLPSFDSTPPPPPCCNPPQATSLTCTLACHDPTDPDGAILRHGDPFDEVRVHPSPRPTARCTLPNTPPGSSCSSLLPDPSPRTAVSPRILSFPCPAATLGLLLPPVLDDTPVRQTGTREWVYALWTWSYAPQPAF